MRVGKCILGGITPVTTVSPLMLCLKNVSAPTNLVQYQTCRCQIQFVHIYLPFRVLVIGTGINFGSSGTNMTMAQDRCMVTSRITRIAQDGGGQLNVCLRWSPLQSLRAHHLCTNRFLLAMANWVHQPLIQMM